MDSFWNENTGMPDVKPHVNQYTWVLSNGHTVQDVLLKSEQEVHAHGDVPVDIRNRSPAQEFFCANHVFVYSMPGDVDQPHPIDHPGPPNLGALPESNNTFRIERYWSREPRA